MPRFRFEVEVETDHEENCQRVHAELQRSIDGGCFDAEGFRARVLGGARQADVSTHPIGTAQEPK